MSRVFRDSKITGQILFIKKIVTARQSVPCRQPVGLTPRNHAFHAMQPELQYMGSRRQFPQGVAGTWMRFRFMPSPPSLCTV